MFHGFSNIFITWNSTSLTKARIYKVFESFSHSRKYCVCGWIPTNGGWKKTKYSPQKIHMQTKKQPFEKARQIIFQTFILGFHVIFQGCRTFGTTFSSISVQVSRYRRVSPRGAFAFRVSGASSISQPLGLCTTKTPSKSFKLLKLLCWFDGFAMLCS